MRFGEFPDAIRTNLMHPNNIWIHAVSVGEVLAVSGLVRQLKEKLPQAHIVLSTTTRTGHEVAVSKLKEVDLVIYSPFDLSWVVEEFVRSINPKIYIAVETEIWPNLFKHLSQKKVPIVIVNGRISQKTFEGYKRLAFFMKKILACVNTFCMQSPTDIDRLENLGVSDEHLRLVGNVKFDELPAPPTRLDLKDLGLPPNAGLWIAGSTHAGEEAIVLKVFKNLTAAFPNLRLIIVPRHIERTNEVVALVNERGFFPVKFSQKRILPGGTDSVIVVDTIGHLRSLYALAHVVFVGKSLTAQGGQNIIEPAFFSKPILVGPHMQNFQDVLNTFLKEEAIVQVNDAEDLEIKLKALLNDPVRMKMLGQKARRTIEQNQGATKRTSEILIKKWQEIEASHA